MPRIPRGQLIGRAFHLLNRGNGRATVFHSDGDYSAFIRPLAMAKQRAHVRIAAFCVMPNHLVVEPENSERHWEILRIDSLSVASLRLAKIFGRSCSIRWALRIGRQPLGCGRRSALAGING